MGYWLEDSPPGSMAFLHNTQTKCGDKTLAADLSIYFKDKRRHNGCSITVSIWIQGMNDSFDSTGISFLPVVAFTEVAAPRSSVHLSPFFREEHVKVLLDKTLALIDFHCFALGFFRRRE